MISVTFSDDKKMIFALFVKRINDTLIVQDELKTTDRDKFIRFANLHGGAEKIVIETQDIPTFIELMKN